LGEHSVRPDDFRGNIFGVVNNSKKWNMFVAFIKGLKSMDHNQQAVKKMSDKQMFALGLFAATTIISLLLTAMNVRAVIEYGWQVVLLCQMPMALTGFYLGYTLMTAGRKEGLNAD
jgi:hypothetical protein